MPEKARPSSDDLRRDYETHVKCAAKAMADACKAADAALAAGSSEARDHFLKLEQQALKAYENWRTASANIWQRLNAT